MELSLDILLNTPPWEWDDGASDFLYALVEDKKASIKDRITAAELSGEIVVMNDKMADLMLRLVRDTNEPVELRTIAPIPLGPALEYAYMLEFDDDEEEDILSEAKYNQVQEELEKIFSDETLPKNLRRRTLEAAARSPLAWHTKAVKEAYTGGDEDWRLTAVFCMGYVQGFEKEILAALKSDDEKIFYEAVCSAGTQELADAWPTIETLLKDGDTEKSLLIAALEASITVNPSEAVDILMEYSEHEDEEVAEAAEDALGMLTAMTGALDEDDDLEGEDDVI